jgi:ABC-type multidrug transport system ATPase subunit
MIEIRNVTKRYGDKRAVDAVSLDIAAGESLALWGSNGAGKTTLLRCLLGATRYEGEALIEGISSQSKGKQARARIGYVPQSMPTFDMSVAEMILLLAKLRGADPRDGIRRLREFGIDDTLEQTVDSLSGGMKQKLSLTLALLGDPPILLLDEPTANLDAGSQAELISKLVELRRQGRTIVFTSHRWSEVRALADRVMRLENGKQIGSGTIADMEPSHETVTIRVPLPTDALESAVLRLTENGYTAARNGCAVLVTVDSCRKAEPLLLLAQADLAITDFDVEEAS